jgi:predicted CxxxxCH...CXXCH cytochrome family protein
MSRAGVTCVKCHNAGTTATTVPTTGHNNGNVDVANVGYPVNVTKHAAGSGYATCSTSCHNSPAGYSPAFTAPALTWGVNANCNGCHGYPPTAGTNHIGVTGDVCFSCHGNVKNTTTTTTSSAAAFNVPANHMDGVVQGGRCDACHGYPPVRSLVGRGTNLTYSSAKLQNYSGGGGVHDVAGHLPTTLKTSQNLGFSACVTCHPSTSHNQAAVSGFGGFSTQFVQVVVDPKFKFDKNRPIVYNAKQSGTGKTTGTCANVACHFQKSPNWSSEAYTQGH